LVVACLAALGPAPACTVAGSCAGTEANYCNDRGSTPCRGHLVDAHTWESSQPGEDWLPFDGERRWHLSLRDGATGRTLEGRPFDVQVYVSTTPRPEDGGGTFALAAGNLAVVHVWCTGQDALCTGPVASDPLVDVLNDTCAAYYMKAIVRSEPSATIDAGATADATGD
jgi:hypothetical protein